MRDMCFVFIGNRSLNCKVVPFVINRCDKAFVLRSTTIVACNATRTRSMTFVKGQTWKD